MPEPTEAGKRLAFYALLAQQLESDDGPTEAGYCREGSCMGEWGHDGPHTSIDFRAKRSPTEGTQDA